MVQAKYYNLRRRNWQPAVNELVYKREHYLSSADNYFTAKLAPSYSGPFRVYNYLSPTVVQLKALQGDTNKLYKTHLKDLKEIPQPQCEK